MFNQRICIKVTQYFARTAEFVTGKQVYKSLKTLDDLASVQIAELAMTPTANNNPMKTKNNTVKYM